jgi:hypothetical protein
MPSWLEMRDSLHRWKEHSYKRDLLAACARWPAVAPATHPEVFEGLFAASLASAAFWIALVALLR